MFSLTRWTLLAITTAFLSAVTAVDVIIPLNTPANAPLLSKSLVSISIEQDRWTDWAGIKSRNQFFYNTFDNLRALAGSPPHVRVGANSEDRTNFDPAIKNFTAAYLMTQSIAKAFRSPAVKNKGIVLDFVEIGNEPNLYALNGLRGLKHNVSDYVPDWTAFASNISGVAGITLTSHTKFLGGSLGGGRHGWNPRSLADKGLFDTSEGKPISTISQHRYSGSFCSGDGALLQSLMTKAHIRGNTTIFAPDAADAKAMGFRYVLGETNSLSCHGAPGGSSRAGAALRAIDYVLSAVKIGVQQVFFHDGIGYKYNLLLKVSEDAALQEDATPFPSPQPAHVHPQSNRKRPTSVSEITVSHPKISGWGSYENGKLKRAVYAHLRAYLPGSESTARPVEHVGLGFDEGGPKEMIVKRLAIGSNANGYADDKSGVTWGGQTYETPDGRVAG
ncbi:hypothetical protein BDV98DRAFT_659521 [Pterulicium gracile]|uniref:Beta-glucuronidase C-terminal domain-containing protein n=1 Tax=Pterulicium gracile TaxID=1884261 RepID=A0A5C3Q657_9AGAR|nr:hypothetical protein BDV98DRAFT_659521 [Pterula gracilis]